MIGRKGENVVQLEQPPGVGGSRFPRVARNLADRVVVRQHPGGGGADGSMGQQRGLDRTAHRLGLPGRQQEVEVERGVELVGPDVAGQPLRVVHPGLGHEHPRILVLVGQTPPHSVDLVDLVAVPVRVLDRLAGSGRPLDRAQVRQALGLGQAVGDVDAEAVDAQLEPEAHGRRELVPDFGIGPVQVRLFGCEQVQIPLAGTAVAVGDAGPGGAAEIAPPVVRGLRARLAASVAEDEPAAGRRARSGHQRFLEPGVLVGQMVRDEVQQQAQAQLMRFADQGLGLGHRAEARIDGAEVRYVVAAVTHRRAVPRVDPDRVNAELREIGQARAEAGDVADPVAVGVREAADVDLVDDSAAPPGRRLSHAGNVEARVTRPTVASAPRAARAAGATEA